MGPTFSGAPTADDIAAIGCRFKRVATVTQIARQFGTLPNPLYRLRRADLVQIRAEKDPDTGRSVWSAAAIAARVGLSRARVFQLTRPAAEEARP